MADITPWRLIVAPFEETMNSLLQQVNTSLVLQMRSYRQCAVLFSKPVIL